MNNKELVLESFFNKFANLQPGNFITKRRQHSYVPVNIAKFLKTSILKDICERLLLNFIDSKWKKKKKKQTFSGMINGDVFRTQ